ncbi:hypothetical protein DSECCO2_558190 [anaerobic digester metagenome]
MITEAITPTIHQKVTNLAVKGIPKVTGIVGAPFNLSPSTSLATPPSVKAQSVTHIIRPKQIAGRGRITPSLPFRIPAGSNASHTPIGTRP